MDESAYDAPIRQLLAVIEAEMSVGAVSGLAGLRRRLAKLIHTVSYSRTQAELAPIEHEARRWVEAIQSDLLPDLKSRVLACLLEEEPRSGPWGPWRGLDADALTKAAREQEMEFRRLKDVIKSAVTSYLVTGKPTPLRDAVVMLEDAVRAEREQAREIDLVDIHPQAERLRVALEALPMRAREVFVTAVRERVEAGAPGHAPGRKIDQKLSSEQWFRKAWGSEWEPGPFFTPDLQSRYDHARQEAHERRVEAEQHDREYRAAAAAREEARKKKAPVIERPTLPRRPPPSRPRFDTSPAEPFGPWRTPRPPRIWPRCLPQCPPPSSSTSSTSGATMQNGRDKPGNGRNTTPDGGRGKGRFSADKSGQIRPQPSTPKIVAAQGLSNRATRG